MIPSLQPLNRPELEIFFAGISSRLQPAQADYVHGSSRPPVDQRELEQDQHDLERFFADVNSRVHLAETLQWQLDVRLATGFNVFDLIEPDENKLSDVLACLLNPKGAHVKKRPYIPELLLALKKRYETASNRAWWEACVKMQSPAADWHEPKVLWQMHTDPKFLEDVAEQLLGVAKISEPIVDRFVDGLARKK